MDSGETAPSSVESGPNGRRVLLAILTVGLAYAVFSVPPALINLDENWRHVGEGIAIWSVAWLVMAFPLSLVVGVLAARMERAQTGLRHPKRAAWVGVSLGVLLVAHWVVHLSWSPAQLLWGLTGSYRQEAHLVGAVVGLLAWAFAGAGLTLAVRTYRALSKRNWEGVDDMRLPRRLPRIPTPWAIALVYLVFSLPLGVLAVALAADAHQVGPALLLWTGVGFIGPLMWTAVALRIVKGLPHASTATQPAARFFEQLGAIAVLHWVPFWGFTLFAPAWRYQHADQLFCSVYSGLALVFCAALWSYGRTYRSVPR